ncbi:hypothetical protein ACFQ3N_08965 [Virgibacillus byunsanensis]|uniref:Uncharacterized protein n=1 Tax=Virgibacillus byunsanensis TaxID=570945 RepID=A0ABW3LJH5_9BACI
MGNLFEAITGNFFIIVVIIAGIIGFLRDSSAKQKQQERKPSNTPRSTSTPSGGRSRSQGDYRGNQSQQTVSSTSIQDQQNEQMKQVADRMGAKKGIEELPHDAIIGNTLREPPKEELSHDQLKLRQQIGNNLTKKGLVNGIIMAEVLGPPRAKKPYRSVISERR